MAGLIAQRPAILSGRMLRLLPEIQPKHLCKTAEHINKITETGELQYEEKENIAGGRLRNGTVLP